MHPCPVCETANAVDAAECATCGKVLLLEGELEVEAETVEGLEATVLDPLESAVGVVTRFAEVEDTQVADPKMVVAVEALEVDRTRQEEVATAPQFWYGGLDELETGREVDGIPRTAAPVDTGVCAWCNAPGTEVICDGCGRRRLRGRTSAPRAAAGPGLPLTARQRTDAEEDTVLCPGCLTRVQRTDRCPECKTPLPRVELV